ncbi:MAG: hypothetical protein O3A84_09405 [Proteobacteria bacterium]|nr:hypothetical protein [Pseudomonadota bacterium]
MLRVTLHAYRVCLMAVGLLLLAIQPSMAEPKSYMTGNQFLSATPDQQLSYVSGLTDSLTGLFQAQLIDGFRWFETCTAQKLPIDLVRDFSKFLNENPSRQSEFAANNFIWAMAAVCKYDLPDRTTGGR